MSFPSFKNEILELEALQLVEAALHENEERMVSIYATQELRELCIAEMESRGWIHHATFGYQLFFKTKQSRVEEEVDKILLNIKKDNNIYCVLWKKIAKLEKEVTAEMAKNGWNKVELTDDSNFYYR